MLEKFLTLRALRGGNSGGGVSGSDSGGNADQVSVEPTYEDIPKVFFGGALQQDKSEKVVPFRYISKTDDFSGYAEIKAQGNSSLKYPKKNQTVKMFADEACETKMKKNFKGWGKQNKYCYKANWIDITHARNIVSARLWADVVKSRPDYDSLPELLRTSPNQGAVDGFPVKVYADGVYQGRYTLNIPKDKWAFNMDDSLDNHCVLCGENYVSGCFRASANINGSDWSDEIHDSVPASIKTRWNEVISFVMNSTDEEFRANLGNYFYVDSLIDYHLFGLASCGLDAYGKNQLYMTYDGQKWLASMYDMDSTWGLYWNGSKFVSTSYTREEYEDMISDREGNLLYIRLEQLFHAELQTRWAELKNGALSITNVINRFERFTDIAPAELVKEDYASTTGGGKFTGIPSQHTNNIQQIRAFALARLAWTDEYVSALTGESDGETEKTLNSISATYAGGDVPVGTAVTDLTGIVVTATYSDGSTATVTGYTLSGQIAEGSNTVTVSYSGKTTTFAVVGVAESGGDEPESDNIDYTRNPLADVVYTNKSVYDQNTGDMVANNNNACTSKFTLQNCMYRLSDANAKYKSISVWDENGAYIGRTPESSSASDYVFSGKAGYTYAVNFYDTTGGNTLTLMPVDNSANKTEAFIIDLTAGWVDDNSGAKLLVQNACATAGLTSLNCINSADGMVLFTSPLLSNVVSVPAACIYNDINFGGFTLRSLNGKTADVASAFYAEHCPTLTING